MMGLVVYESKYGNTKIVAENIISGIKETKNIDMELKTPKEVKMDSIEQYGFILFGSPNHMGSATRGMRKFIEKVGKEIKDLKKTAVFDTYAGEKQYMKAVNSMEDTIKNKTKNFKIIKNGLSIKVEGMKGPITQGELPKCKKFGEEIITKL